MLNDLVAIVLLLITGVIALVIGISLIKAYLEEKKIHHAFWALSFIVLFVSGVLIILFDFSVLSAPLVPVVAALIPVGLAVGAYAGVWPDKKYWMIYGGYSLLMIIVLLVVQLADNLATFKPMIIMLIHVPAGLSIVLVPIVAIYLKELETPAILFSIGGLLISFGGMLLALVGAAGSEKVMGFIDLAFVLTVLPLVLLLMTICYVLGIVLSEKWGVRIPYLMQ